MTDPTVLCVILPLGFFLFALGRWYEGRLWERMLDRRAGI